MSESPKKPKKAKETKPPKKQVRYRSKPDAVLSANGMRTGRLSLEEQDYIRDNYQEVSAREMATFLNRPIETIISYKDKLVTKGNEKVDLIRDLTREADWEILKQQFNKVELDKFKLEYASIVAQFNNSVDATEKQQILKVIQLSILMDRILIDKQKMTLERDRIENARAMIMDVGIDETDSKAILEHQTIVENFTTQMRSLEAGVRDLSRDFNGYLDKHSKLLSDLKATRNQRLEKIERPGDTFQDLVEYLKQEEVQAHDSRRATLIEKAVKKEKAKLMQEYKFADGTVDHILLTDETPIAVTEISVPRLAPSSPDAPILPSPLSPTPVEAQPPLTQIEPNSAE